MALVRGVGQFSGVYLISFGILFQILGPCSVWIVRIWQSTNDSGTTSRDVLKVLVWRWNIVENCIGLNEHFVVYRFYVQFLPPIDNNDDLFTRLKFNCFNCFKIILLNLRCIPSQW